MRNSYERRSSKGLVLKEGTFTWKKIVGREFSCKKGRLSAEVFLVRMKKFWEKGYLQRKRRMLCEMLLARRRNS